MFLPGHFECEFSITLLAKPSLQSHHEVGKVLLKSDIAKISGDSKTKVRSIRISIVLDTCFLFLPSLGCCDCRSHDNSSK